jgi:hypothetical protein
MTSINIEKTPGIGSDKLVERGKTGQEKKGKKVQDKSVRKYRNGRATKKEPWMRLTKCNHTNLFRILFTRAEDTILTFLAHPGNQELLLGKLTLEPFDFTAAGHADMLLHPGNPVGEGQVGGSWLDAGRVRDRELVAHAVTFLALTSFRYPHVLQLAFCECSA